jgi:hypothetical protein
MERKRDTKGDGRDRGLLPYFLFDFMEILYILAAEHQSANSCNNLALFLQTRIWPLHDKVTPELWLELDRLKKSSQI